MTCPPPTFVAPRPSLARRRLGAFALLLSAALANADDLTVPQRTFLDRHCLECHDAGTAKGGLDLAGLRFAPADPANAARWVAIHDRIRDGEMPPAKKPRPETQATRTFLATLATPLIAADQERTASQGRATWRRLNRLEYENSLRELLNAPWLQIKDILPEDGEVHRFNKSGEALDISHVQMAQYLAAAEYALRQVIAGQPQAPPTRTRRFHARDEPVFARKMIYNQFNNHPERATFPVLGNAGEPEIRAQKKPITVGEADPATRDREGMAVVASSYEPIELRFDHFQAPHAGRYRLRLCAHTVWVAASAGANWWKPDLNRVGPGRRSEPITISSETKPRQLRWQGVCDIGIEPTIAAFDVWLLKGETIRVDAARLFRSRPPGPWRNPLAEKDGQPGVSFRWLEVEGPLISEWPSAGHRLLFGDLALRTPAASDDDGHAAVVSADPQADAARLLRAFMARAYRRPVAEADVLRLLALVRGALASGSSFTEAMLAGYTGVLCSPAVVCLEERPGTLDDHALAARLSFLLVNSAPDDRLRQLVASAALRNPATLRAEVDRLLDDARSQRFVDAFLAYWLDLRRLDATSPDAELYPDYYLDDLLTESALFETRLFFGELLRADLPVRHLVASDFAMLNESLAAHYRLPPLSGVTLRKVALPADSVRGGLLTHASVLKVTANGTTTSPVVRGAWVMERLLGKPPPPPPPSVPAVEPDTRGAHTIREQLAAHRTQESCAACHARIDPAGFALESFDVLGGWRDRYRALGGDKTVTKEVGFGKNGQPFAFHLAQPVDPSGSLPDGRAFRDIREFKQLLLADERQLARNLLHQLTVYATGAPVRFGDRPAIEAILDRTAAAGFGVRALVHGLVQSPLFLGK